MVELDAAIMEGKTSGLQSLCGVRGVKNPILLARRVMENSEHVMFAGKGAERFAAEQGFTRMPDEYFITERRAKELTRAKQEDATKPSHLTKPGSKITKERFSRQNKRSSLYDENAPLNEWSHEGKKFGNGRQ